MTARDGKPCKRCGTSEWYASGNCAQCARESSTRWRQANLETAIEKNRQWRRENPEKDAAQKRRWRKANPKNVAEHKIRWQRANPEKHTASTRRWRKANPEKNVAQSARRRTAKTNAGGSYTAAEWKALVEHYGSRCLCCGRTDVKLTVDHVIPVAKGGTSSIDNLQPLCSSCNVFKGTKEVDYRPGKGLGRWIQSKIFG